jgi:hypothetical protein
VGRRERQGSLNLERLNHLIPWLSLSWGVFSIFLIEHGTNGIQKVLFFAALFSAAALSGVLLPRERWKKAHWLRSASQQAAAQYILFFAVPLLWKAHSWAWFCLTSLLAISTLWDPYFSILWKRNWYRILLITCSIVFVSGLSLVVWAPRFLHLNLMIAIGICVLGLILSHILMKENDENDTLPASHLRRLTSYQRLKEASPLLLLLSFMLLTRTPIPPLGVWIAEGKLLANPLNRSLQCITRIAAPAGFESTVTHVWTFRDNQLLHDAVPLSPISGNGIDDKPYTTRSEKMSFPLPWNAVVRQVVRCEVQLPGGIPIGHIDSSVSQ